MHPNDNNPSSFLLLSILLWKVASLGNVFLPLINYLTLIKAPAPYVIENPVKPVQQIALFTTSNGKFFHFTDPHTLYLSEA